MSAWILLLRPQQTILNLSSLNPDSLLVCNVPALVGLVSRQIEETLSKDCVKSQDIWWAGIRNHSHSLLLLLFLLCIGAEEIWYREQVLCSHSEHTSSNVWCYYCCCWGYHWILKMQTYIIAHKQCLSHVYSDFLMT